MGCGEPVGSPQPRPKFSKQLWSNQENSGRACGEPAGSPQTAGEPTRVSRKTCESLGATLCASSAQFESYPFTQDKLRTRISTIFDVLPARMLTEFWQAVEQRLPSFSTKPRVATACSGVDTPIYAIRELFEFMNSVRHNTMRSRPEFHHVFSCEINSNLRDFIYAQYKPDRIFEDIVQLGGAQFFGLVKVLFGAGRGGSFFRRDTETLVYRFSR